MKTIKFSKNFNNKLDCTFFTTFRVSDKWKIDENVIILLNDHFKIGKIVDVKKIHISSLTDWHCYLDAGASKIDTLLLLDQYYNIDVKSENSYVFYYLIRSLDYWHDMSHVQPFIEL